MGVKVNCELLKKEMLIEGIYKFSVKAPEIAKIARPSITQLNLFFHIDIDFNLSFD